VGSATTINKAALQALRDRARRDVDAGLPFGGVEGCSIALAKDGEILWEEGFGAACADTPILLLSITKTVFESALWQLFAGSLKPEDRVLEIIPDFMSGTAPDLTIGMLETHMGGFPWAPLDFPEAADRDTRLAAFREWRTDRKPGEAYEYHPLCVGWVLAEIVERVSGVDYRTFLKRQVLEPLGLSGVKGVSLGEPISALKDVLLHHNCMYGWAPDPSKRAPMVYGLDTHEGLALGTPGAGGVGTASGVARLYQAYLSNPGELWNPAIHRDAISRTRIDGPDPVGRPMLRTLSFLQAGPPEGRFGERDVFGSAVSDRTFGHGGQGGQIAWADPDTGLSFCYLTNTVVFPPFCFHPRARELSSLAARVLNR
jgi:CubicO group peptidase (beta-lactamase class C family)